MPLGTVSARTRGMPRSVWGTAVAHLGMAVTLLGIVSASTWGEERIVALKQGQTVVVCPVIELSFDGMIQRAGPNFRELTAKFTAR